MNAIRNLKKVGVVALAAVLIIATSVPASAQVGFGRYCQTPFGLYGPGMPLPLGSACYVNTWNLGTVWGFIV